MRIMAFHLFFCFSCVAVLISQSYGQEAERSALESRLREEAPPAWKRLESKHKQTRFDWKETETNNSRDEQKVGTMSGSNCYRGEDFVIRLKREGGERVKVWGGSNRYLFTVVRDSDEGSWALGHFGPPSDDPAVNGDDEYGQQLRTPWYIYDVPCRLLIADPSFRIQSLEKKPDGSVELQFSVRPRSTDDRDPQLTSGRVVLLPDRDWAISSHEVLLTRPGRPDYMPVVVSASVVYGPEEDNFLNFTHTKYKLRWQSGEKQRWISWERDVICQHCDEPVESFSLASFGLSEPTLPGEASAKTRPWLWLNVIAIVCLLVAIILRSRRKAREEYSVQGNRHWRLVFLTLVGVGLLLPIIAAALYVSSDDEPLVMDPSTIIVEGSPGSKVVLEVLISNRGKRTARVLGASTLQPCLPSGCVKEVPDLPLEIEGHESRTTRVVYRIGRQIEPPYVLTFYTDCVSQPQLDLTIRNKYTEQQ